MSKSTVTPIKACLFDMDGLLINTEDMYTEATNELLAQYNKGSLPWEVKIGLQGLPGPEASKKLLEWAQLPLTPDELMAKTKVIQATKWQHTKFLPGAAELLKYLDTNKIPFALATSSNTANYELKTAHLRDIFDRFGKHVVTGDDPRIPPGRGKPAPDIWLVALESINQDRRKAGLEDITPAECLVFEDGVPGVAAGRAAGATVIWVPHKEALKVLPKDKVAEVIGDNELLDSLTDFNKAKYGLVVA